MKHYRYQLDTTSKKYRCPECGQKRFVRFIDSETSLYAAEHFGRCDREVQCAYFLYPISETYYPYSYDYTPTLPKKTLATSYIDISIAEATLCNYEINPLISYLYKRYDADKIEKLIHMYNVGTAMQYGGSTVYWQIDNTGNIRAGKVMGYDKDTGKRLKSLEGKPQINWAHKLLKNDSNYNLKQCLYGLHLLSNKTKVVYIVESEKTALIMAIELPKLTWMATGSLTAFKRETLSPIKNCEVIAFPDKGAYSKWLKVANMLNLEGFKIKVTEEMEQDQYKEGWDLVDAIEFEENKEADQS
jgi:hypothetical protein